MTLEEKIGQLHQVGPSSVGAFDIPETKSYEYYIGESKLQLYIFMNDYYLN